MKKPRRRFQFRLRTLLIVVTLAASFCAVLARLDFREPRQVVEEILAADMSPEARMKALNPYIHFGQSKSEIDELLGAWHDYVGFGPGFCSAFYQRGLIIDYYPDGDICTISYQGKDGRTDILQSDDPITWPKTTGAKNASIHRKHLRES